MQKVLKILILGENAENDYNVIDHFKKLIMFIDTHCHLSMEPLNSRINQVIQTADSDFVKKMVTMGTNYEDSIAASKIALENESVYFSVGYHPEECMRKTLENAKKEFENIMKIPIDSNCIAIGEVGLDNRWLDYITESEFNGDEEKKSIADNVQSEIFRMSLKWALDIDLPVIIHCRESEEYMYPILNNFAKNGGRGVLHSYTGNSDFMLEFINRGWFVSFNGIITFKNGQNVRDLLKLVPPDKVLLETDAPFLAPDPFRGQVCEPKHVVEVYKKASNIMDIDITDLEVIVEQNYLTLFGR